MGGVPNTPIRRAISSVREGCPYEGEYQRGWRDACDRIDSEIPDDGLELPSLGGSLFGESIGRLLQTPLGEKISAKLGRI